MQGYSTNQHNNQLPGPLPGRKSILNGRYERGQLLGKGTFGEVWKARDMETGNEYAIKRILQPAGEENEGVPSTAIREISILKELKHPHIVDLVEQFWDGKLSLVFEYLKEDLKILMDRMVQPLTTSTVRGYAYQLLDSVQFCHSHRIVHRDLKPQNILVDGDTLKLADFGLARDFQIPLRTYTHEIITLWYRAPEVLLGATRYAPAVDVWSVGCILLEMATKKPVFPGDSEIHQLFLIFQMLGTPNEQKWPGVTRLKDFSLQFPRWKAKDLKAEFPGVDLVLLDLISQMLRYDASSRISAREALQHPFFTDNLNDLPGATLPSGGPAPMEGTEGQW